MTLIQKDGALLKWKSKLISSSLPLEYEAAKILVSKGFSITADFAYSRIDCGVSKDFSVDLHASGFPPFSNPNEILATLDVLVECKQRHQNIIWLFFPDPNRPDFSPITLGYTLHAVDKFSRYFFMPDATVSFDKKFKFCYKGIEIDESSGSVYDAELKHGITQLQYALPRLYTHNAFFNITNHPDDNRPFLFCSILLTTANLYVAHKGMTAVDVEKSSSPKDIADLVPYLAFYSDYGPDFESHCRKECAALRDLSKMKSLLAIEAYRRKNGEYNHLLPSSVSASFADGMGTHFTQFIVCTMKNFPPLIDSIKRISAKSVRNLQSSSTKSITILK